MSGRKAKKRSGKSSSGTFTKPDTGLSIGTASLANLMAISGPPKPRRKTKKVYISSDDKAKIEGEVTENDCNIVAVVSGIDQLHEEVEEQIEKPVCEKYNFSRNKRSGYYGVRNKGNGLIFMTIKSVIMPFGVEIYNDNEIMNIWIKPYSNYHHNIIVYLKSINDDIKNLVNDSFFDYIDSEDGLDYYNLIEEDKEKDGHYIVRCHLNKSVKINHPDFMGNYDKHDLKGRVGDIKMHMGSVWKNAHHYGCTMYIDRIDIKTIREDD